MRAVRAGCCLVLTWAVADVAAGAQPSGVPTTRSAPVTLQILPPGVTSFSGQILDEDAQPVKGAVVKLGTLQTTTDDAGGFLLVNPSAGPDQLLLIDGGPASSPGKSFPIIPYKVTIVAGQDNTLGFTPHLHFQKTTGLVDISNSGIQRVVTQDDIPGFQMTIPAGVTITGWDGQPNTQVSIRRFAAADRTAIPPLPAGLYSPSGYMFYFGKQGGGTPSTPIPITVPNDLGVPPGTQVELWFYDEAPDGSRPNQMAKFGTGTVSTDGSQVLPDTDPATGKPFGQPRFCCGWLRIAIDLARRAQIQALLGTGVAEAAERKTAGEPVNLSTGTFSLEKTDLVLPGRLPLAFTRTYRSQGPPAGPFGFGTSQSYQVLLLIQSNLRTLVLPSGAQLALPQQGNGSWQNFTDPSVRGAVITASGSNHILRFKDGSTWTFGTPLTGAGGVTGAFLIAQADRNGNTVTLTRTGPFQNLTTITEPAGRQLTLTYDASNRITAIADPIGRTVTYTYGPAGLTSVTDPAGGVTQYSYDGQGRMLTLTDPRGITYLTNTYDANGRVVQQTQADGGVWQLSYTTTAGAVTQTVVTGPRSNATTYRFNGQGYHLSQTDALGQATTFARDPATNLLRATTDLLGRTTRFAYDANGNATSVTDPAGNARTFTYEPTFNRVTSITDPLGNISRFQYDPANGNLLSITDPLGNATQLAYNAFGQPLSMTDALGNVTQFTYNAEGDLATIADPLGNTTTRAYDQVSRLVQETNPRGKRTTFGYDPLNRLLSIVDALGGTTAFTYDPNGNLLTATDARGNNITHQYDSMDRIVRRVDPLGAPETFSYDSSANTIQKIDRKGQPKLHTYDALNRRVRSDYADGSIVTFQYDPAGRLTQVDDTADPQRPITLAYDLLDRLVSETTALSAVSYQYDALGRRTQMTFAGQAPVTYTYDVASRLRTIAQAPLRPVDIQYDPLGRRTLLTLPNAVSTEYQYDAASRLTALIYRNAGGLLGDLTYQYDPAGNRIAVGGSFAGTLLPDAVASATYDAADRQLTFGTKAMTFDANGSLASLADSAGGTIFTWDARNRLTGLNGPGLSGAFTYDGVGRRVQKVVNGQQSQFQYDLVNIQSESRNGRPVSYLRGLSIDEVFIATDDSGPRHATTDTLGSVLTLTDAAGTLQAEYRYGPFGQTQPSGQDGGNPFQFTGRENDGTGLYYYRFRYYQQTLGRFISEDPLRPLTGAALNLYAYAGNSPLNAVDPFGLYEEDVHRDLTFCLARHAGFPEAAARRIAAGDQGTDDNWETSPYRSVQARRDWHFTTEERRTELWQRALSGGLDELGQYLHALQDSYSHEGFEPVRGHASRLSAPDKTYNDPEKANRMARDSYNRLRQYLQQTTGQQVPDQWDQVRTQVDRFNRARTASDKQRYLFCR